MAPAPFRDQPQSAEEFHCSPSVQRTLLGESPFFSSLTGDQIADVTSRFRQQHYHAGDVVQLAGDAAERLSIVGAGVVRMSRPTPDGQDVLLDLRRPGEHFGSLVDLGDEKYREDVVAQTGCCILFTTSDIFRSLLETYPAVARASLSIVSERLRDAHEAIERISAYPVEQRVASILLHLAARIGKSDEHGVLIDMPLARQDIADMVGAKVETVSRVMSEMRREGTIESGRKWIRVLDLAGLGDRSGIHSVN